MYKFLLLVGILALSAGISAGGPQDKGPAPAAKEATKGPGAITTSALYAEALLKSRTFSHLTTGDAKKRMHRDDAVLFAGDLDQPIEGSTWHLTAFIYGNYQKLQEPRQLKIVTPREFLKWKQFRFLLRHEPKDLFRNEGNAGLTEQRLETLMLRYFSVPQIGAAEKALARLAKSDGGEKFEDLIKEAAALDAADAKELEKSRAVLKKSHFAALVNAKENNRMHLDDAHWFAGPAHEPPGDELYHFAAFIAVIYRDQPADKQPKKPTAELVAWWMEFRHITRYEPEGLFRRDGRTSYDRAFLNQEIKRYFTRAEYAAAQKEFEKLTAGK